MTNMRRAALAAVVAVAMAAGLPVLASHEATVLLKSGERLSGIFEDIENGRLYLRLSLEDQRQIPLDQVAVVDFVGGTRGLPETELAEARKAGDLLMLRGGSSYKGKLEDVVGDRDMSKPEAELQIVFRKDDGQVERVSASQVARLYVGALPDISGVPGAVATTGTSAPEPTPDPRSTSFGPDRAGWVDAKTPWTPTGIHVREGDLVSFTAEGEVKIGENHVAGPAGSTRQQYSGTAPLPRDLMGALIGRVAGSPAFGIGDLTRPVRMPATGQLYLGINAGPGDAQSLEGGFNVTVTHHQAAAPRR